MNEQGVALAEKGELDEAGRAFEASLELDPTFGPARNNLGIVYFKQANFYEAAWQLNLAAKTMPRAASVRTNLGLVLESANRPDLAIEQYEKALSFLPDDPVATSYLARAAVRANRDKDELTELLKKVSLQSLDESWNSWARGQLIRLGCQGAQ